MPNRSDAIKFDDAWTGPDKTKHFVGGALIALLVSFVSQDAFIGFAAYTVVALAKELIYDLAMKKGTCSFQDLVVTMTGGFAGSLMFIAWQVST